MTYNMVMDLAILGGSVPTPDETRALLEWSENSIDSFRDGD